MWKQKQKQKMLFINSIISDDAVEFLEITADISLYIKRDELMEFLDINIVNENCVSVYRGSDMRFVTEKDVVCEYIRIYVDEPTKAVLDLLKKIIKNVDYYRYLTDTVINEWITKISQDNSSSVVYFKDKVGYQCFSLLRIDVATWERFKEVSNTKDISVQDSFKSALMEFIEDRTRRFQEDFNS